MQHPADWCHSMCILRCKRHSYNFFSLHQLCGIITIVSMHRRYMHNIVQVRVNVNDKIILFGTSAFKDLYSNPSKLPFRQILKKFEYISRILQFHFPFSTAIAQEYYELYWTNPGSNIPQNSRCTAIYHPSQKWSK